MSLQTEVAVIGGGINGAGIAQAVAAAGYRVALFERSDWGDGTSSRSSKLIHGGLRYLETAELSLVYNSLYERQLLLRNAPQLVKPVRFHIPVYRDTSRRPWQIFSGLSLYRTLARFRTLSDFHLLPKKQWSQLDGLDTKDLQAVFQYWDAQTDDRELTRAVQRSAQQLGAECFCPAELLRAERHDEHYQLELRTPDGGMQCSAQVLINASGPWVNEVAQRVHPAVPMRPSSLVRGSHILLPGQLTKGIYYLEAPLDRRAVFAMPWQGNTLVGTTEREHTGSPDAPEVSESEQCYLQETYQRYFPGHSAEVLDGFAGLRVLPAGGGTAFERSREAFVLCDHAHTPHMIALYGGKLTSYRHTAEKIARMLSRSLGRRVAIADTRHLPLS